MSPGALALSSCPLLGTRLTGGKAHYCADHGQHRICVGRREVRRVTGGTRDGGVDPFSQEPNLAPQGQHVLAANVMYVPHDLKSGWTPESRAELLNTVLSELHVCPRHSGSRARQ